MKLEDFGFNPVHGKKYTVNFTSEGELISTSTYNGQPLPQTEYPDNSVINLTVTDKDTGKSVFSSEYISYNGKLYKSIFNLPMDGKSTNKNKDVKLHDLHYDLTTGSVLVKVQGFAGEKYKLKVANTEVKTKASSMEITLKEGTFYSIPTTLVQGNEFEITLFDNHNKPVSSQIFTAPIDTDWRSTQEGVNTEIPKDAEGNEVEKEVHDLSKPEEETSTTAPEGLPQEQIKQESTTSSLLSMEGKVLGMDKPVALGGFATLLLFFIVLLAIRAKMTKKMKRKKMDEEDAVNFNRSRDGDIGEENFVAEERLEEGRLDIVNMDEDEDDFAEPTKTQEPVPQPDSGFDLLGDDFDEEFDDEPKKKKKPRK